MATLHYANAKARVDEWQDITVVTALGKTTASPWKGAVECTTPDP